LGKTEKEREIKLQGVRPPQPVIEVKKSKKAKRHTVSGQNICFNLSTRESNLGHSPTLRPHSLRIPKNMNFDVLIPDKTPIVKINNPNIIETLGES